MNVFAPARTSRSSGVNQNCSSVDPATFWLSVAGAKWIRSLHCSREFNTFDDLQVNLAEEEKQTEEKISPAPKTFNGLARALKAVGRIPTPMKRFRKNWSRIGLSLPV